MRVRVAELAQLETEARLLSTETVRIRQQMNQCTDDLETAGRAKTDEATYVDSTRILEGYLSTKSQVEATLQHIGARMAEYLTLKNRSEEIEPLHIRFDCLPPLDSLRSNVERRTADVQKTKAQCEALEARLSNEQLLLARSKAVGPLMRIWKRLPKPEDQEQIVSSTKSALFEERRALDVKVSASRNAEALLNEGLMLEEKLKPFQDVPRISSLVAAIEKLRSEETGAVGTLRELSRKIDATAHIVSEFKARLDLFATRFQAAPDAVAAQARSKLQSLEANLESSEAVVASAQRLRTELEAELSGRVVILKDWGLLSDVSRSAEAMADAIAGAHKQALLESSGLDLFGTRREIESLNARMVSIAAEILEIDEALKHVEEIVIQNATIVATTLTRVYLRDSIQKRRFDTVLVDEASMAPIPALWLAAALADANIVVVGDFRQLPPVVQSNHELAKRWLGTDIFEINGVRKAYEQGAPPAYFTALLKQYRMHPDICAIPNTLFYNGKLITDSSAESDGPLGNWYNANSAKDPPLRVVDTGRTGAWVTTVNRGGSLSCPDGSERAP